METVLEVTDKDRSWILLVAVSLGICNEWLFIIGTQSPVPLSVKISAWQCWLD